VSQKSLNPVGHTLNIEFQMDYAALCIAVFILHTSHRTGWPDMSLRALPIVIEEFLFNFVLVVFYLVSPKSMQPCWS